MLFGKSARPATKSSDDVVITDAAPCQKALSILVKPEAIAPVRLAVQQEFQREATLPGFRKGKAPIELVERHHANAIQEETLQRVTQQTLEQVAKAHRLKPVGPFEVTKADFAQANGLTLEATVEVEPSFTLAEYKGIALDAGTLEVRAEEVDRALAKLQESMAQLVPVGTGETKERQVPALDQEFAKDLGFDTLDKLKEHVQMRLVEQKRAAQRQAQESAVCDELIKRHAFDVPSRLVGRQTERLTRDFTVRLLLSGVPEDTVQGEVAKFTEQLRTSAEQHVKLGFILERIAEKESVTVTQDEVVGRLWELAKRWKKDPADVRKSFDAQRLWPSVISTIRQEKTRALLLHAAVIGDGAAGSGSQKPSA